MQRRSFINSPKRKRLPVETDRRCISPKNKKTILSKNQYIPALKNH